MYRLFELTVRASHGRISPILDMMHSSPGHTDIDTTASYPSAARTGNFRRISVLGQDFVL